MAKPKILIGLTYYLPNISGVTQYVSILAEELEKRKYEVKIMTSKSGNLIESEGNVNRVAGFHIGKGFVMPMYWLKSIELVKWAEIVNCHLPSVESFWLAVWAKYFKKKLVVTYHCQMKTGSRILDKIIDVTQNFICGLAQVIVVNTRDYIEGYGLLNNCRDKLVEIYPPIKMTKSDKNINFKTRKVIGFLGRMSREKNIEMLIEAFKKIKGDYSLILAGPETAVGEEIYKQNIEQLIYTDKRITKIGKVENTADFYKSIDCLVLPANNPLESFGMVQAEAMLNGIPCVTSNLPGVRVPILTAGMGELFELNDAEDLRKKILLVLENGKFYYQKNARNLDLFDYKKTVDGYEKLFEGVKKTKIGMDRVG